MALEVEQSAAHVGRVEKIISFRIGKDLLYTRGYTSGFLYSLCVSVYGHFCIHPYTNRFGMT